jgi:hypothetical protein
MATLPDLASRLVQSSLHIVGPAVAGAARRRRQGRATVVRGVDMRSMLPPAPPHPLLPSAVRVERSRRRGGNGFADQVAVTLWFREGPALPGLGPAESGGSELSRIALRLGIGLARAGAGLAATAAIGAATVAAQRLEAARRPSRRLDRPAPPPPAITAPENDRRRG